MEVSDGCGCVVLIHLALDQTSCESSLCLSSQPYGSSLCLERSHFEVGVPHDPHPVSMDGSDWWKMSKSAETGRRLGWAASGRRGREAVLAPASGRERRENNLTSTHQHRKALSKTPARLLTARSTHNNTPHHRPPYALLCSRCLTTSSRR